MADELYDYYTLPDGKEVRFEQGTAADVVDKHLLSKYPESMAFKPEEIFGIDFENEEQRE